LWHLADCLISRINIAGRIFASNQSSFQCYTAPAYKPAFGNVSFVAGTDPNYSRLPWARLGGAAGWGAVLILVPLLCAFIFALAYVLITNAMRKRRVAQEVASSQYELSAK
jgi:hypothetical protein